ncbi:hypothetical protein EDB83DRAFT_467582 [Lactarius deliciosus]|nr:hypothetical protein EDB83DRAFT_467582 [Lactarius deliciosus]
MMRRTGFQSLYYAVLTPTIQLVVTFVIGPRAVPARHLNRVVTTTSEMTTPKLCLSPILNHNNFVFQVGRTVSPSRYFTLGVRLPRSSSPSSPTNPRPIKSLLWVSQIYHAAAMSRVGRLLQASNARGDVLKNWRHQLPPAPLKSLPVPVVTAGVQLRRRQSRGLGQDGPAFQTSRFACLVHLEACSDVLKSGTNAGGQGRVWIALRG